MKKPRKAKLITPFFMLLAGAITSVILYVRGVDFLTMLLTLLIVLLVFYVIGDVIRYIYEMVQPRVIAMDVVSFFVDENGNPVEGTDEEQSIVILPEDKNVAEDIATETETQDEADEEAFAEEDFAEDDEYSEEDLAEQM